MTTWVQCFVSVRFDLDVGPVVEYVTPAGSLSKEGERQIAQASFPDCNPDCGHDFIFFFTIRDSVLEPTPCSSSQQPASSSDLGAGEPSLSVNNASFPTAAFGVVPRVQSNLCFGDATSVSISDRPKGSADARMQQSQLLLGAAHYRQKKDASVPRGYVQQVVLLLSRLPYVLVHELIMRVVVPRFNQCCHLSPDAGRTPVASVLGPAPSSTFSFDASFHPAHSSQAEVLDQALQEVNAWPSPHPHVQYSVSLLNQSLTFTTPPRVVRPQRGRLNNERKSKIRLDERTRILDATQAFSFTQSYVPLYHILGDHLSHLTRLWELLMTHRSLLVLSNTPSMSSAAAIAIVSLIMPLQFVGDLRSYFTVQDGDFSAISQLGKPVTPFPTHYSVVVSGTNPFFVRAFSGWKNLISVCDPFSNRAVCGRGLVSSTDDDNQLERTESSQSAGSPRTPLSTASSSHERTSSTNSWTSLQWGFHNTFHTAKDVEFTLDHKDQSQVLQQRVSQCQRMSQLVHEAAAQATVPQNPIQATTMMDDVVKKFFSSLTLEALRPIRLWFEHVVSTECESFQLCCPNVLDTPLFHPSNFLAFFRDNRKTVAPQCFTRKTSYKHYKSFYERFCGGVLFRSYIEQLADEHVLSEIASFHADEWVVLTPLEKRVDMFINLSGAAAREWESPDPDLVFLASSSAVLTEMAMRCPMHLQSGLLSKVDVLRIV